MISLGQKDSYPTDCCSPMNSASKEAKVRYPTMYFTCDEDCEIPDSGTAVIKFRKIESTETKRNDEDLKYRYELEVQGIEVKAGKVADMPEPTELIKKGLRKKLNMEEE